MPSYPLYDFSYIPNPNEVLRDLAALAQAESWDYHNTQSPSSNPILFSYLHYTFTRIEQENKICVLSDKACYNTGLVTENQEEIYQLFDLNNIPGKQKWVHKRFCKQSDRELLTFDPLPEIANYFADPAELILDTRLDMRVNVEHIIEDNKERFPEPFKSQTTFQLTMLLDGAIAQAKRRVRRNYKTAIPQFYQGRIQLLLPLCLSQPSKADLALVVERHANVYRASTCLTLDMAYNNARLLAKPDAEWLEP